MSRAEQFTTVRTEGGLLPPGLLARVAAGDPTLAGLTTDSYHLTGSERFGEVITRSWLRLTGAWTSFRDAISGLAVGDPATGITRDRWLLILFSELGYGRLPTARALEVDGVAYPISHSWGNVPVHLVGAGVDLDRRTPGVAGAARSSPHSLLQELLNRDDTRLWGFVSNGLRLRILRDNQSLTRQAFVEFDLEAMMDENVYSDFVVLWLLCHQSRVEADAIEECWLERWSIEARTQGTRALDHLRDGVEAAIASLGSGFLAHPANADLRTSLQSGEVRPIDYYRQLLRVIYRMLFLLVAEERNLLLLPDADPEARRRYVQYYSLSRVRDLSERRRGTGHGDLWAQIQTVIVLLGSADGCPQLGMPALGSFLFSPAATPSINDAAIANTDLLAAVRALSGRNDDRGRYRQRFDYKNLGVEELGSVYESLLELHPDVNVPARTFMLTHGGSERRATGSHYTPPAILKQVLDFALDPAIDRAGRQPDPEAALLDLRILDPACGSGHFLTAAGHRIARALASARTGEVEATPEEVRRALRDVVVRCLYGVDLNPMAVELCRVALWLETLEPGKPLSFLDHHIRVGNSLLGVPLGTTVARNRAAVEAERKAVEERIAVADAERRNLAALDPRCDELAREVRSLRSSLGDLVYDSWADAIPDAAFKATSNDDRAYARRIAAANKRQRSSGQLVLANVLVELPDELVAEFDQLGATAEASVAEVTIRAEMFEGLQRRAEYRHLLDQANTWTAVWFWSLLPGEPVPPTQELFNTLKGNPGALPTDMRARIVAEAEDRRFMHFELAFPEIFAADRGGWDVCLGNPPYLGGTKISTTFGERVFEFLKESCGETAGKADLAAHFLRRGFDVLRQGGSLGFVTTNSVAEGVTRKAGLDTITGEWGGTLVDALSGTRWEGAANVIVSVVHLYRGEWLGRRTLDGRDVQHLSTTLLPHEDLGAPTRLRVNHGLSFEGFKLDGIGFVLEPDRARRLLDSNPRFGDVIFPYIGAEEVMNDPRHAPRRYVIDFFDWPLTRAEQYPECLEIVLQKVKPARDGAKRKATRERWWIYGETRPGLRAAIANRSHVLVIPKHSKTALPIRLSTDLRYSHALAVITTDDWSDYGVLTSNVHWLWAAAWGSRIKSDLRYTTSDCFETFPRPRSSEAVVATTHRLHDFRTTLQRDLDVGVSRLYGRVYDPVDQTPEVVELRRIHGELDAAVLSAYGWEDLIQPTRHYPTDRYGIRWTLPPEQQRSVVQRLVDLNRQHSSP